MEEAKDTLPLLDLHIVCFGKEECGKSFTLNSITRDFCGELYAWEHKFSEEPLDGGERKSITKSCFKSDGDGRQIILTEVPGLTKDTWDKISREFSKNYISNLPAREHLMVFLYC